MPLIWADSLHNPLELGKTHSLIQTCIINKIDPYKYLRYTLDQGHAMRRGEIDPVKLLPQFIDRALLENQ